MSKAEPATPEVFAALGDPTRFAIVARLASGGDQPIAALAAETELTRQAVTKHLHILEQAGLVESHRHGRETRFAYRGAAVAGARDWLDGVAAGWARRIDGLKLMVEPSDGNA